MLSEALSSYFSALIIGDAANIAVLSPLTPESLPNTYHSNALPSLSLPNMSLATLSAVPSAFGVKSFIRLSTVANAVALSFAEL